jgi:sorbitol/mannitol transport system permease protein
MATKASRTAARAMISPSVILLLGWMIIPLGLTLYFSVLRYNLLMPGPTPFVGIENYEFFITNPAFTTSLINTLLLVLGVLVITVIGGILLALLLNLDMWGQGIVRVLVIAPFFVMPTVSALVWKNMFMNPVNGLFAYIAKALGLQPFDFRTGAARVDHRDRELAVAAVCDAHSADGDPVARQRTA